MKPKGAADGQQVNIPVPLLYGWLLKKDSGSLLRIEAKVLEVDGEVNPVII